MSLVDGHPQDHRLLGAAAVHALRDVPADLPDLRRDRPRAQQPARPHRADAGDRRRRARGQPDLRRGDELLPGMPRLPDRVPGRRELRRAVRNGAQRHPARERRRQRPAPLLARADAELPVHAPAGAARRGQDAAALSALGAGGPGAAAQADQPSPGGPAPARAAGAGDCRAVLGSVDRGTRGARRPRCAGAWRC